MTIAVVILGVLVLALLAALLVVLLKRPSSPDTTEEQTLDLRNLPKFRDVGDLFEFSDAHAERFPSLKQYDHSCKASFVRLLTLHPGFTVELVGDVSSVNPARVELEPFSEKILTAYRLMSRLVDQSDITVVRQGQIDDLYLCR